jgi:hypothetical protein
MTMMIRMLLDNQPDNIKNGGNYSQRDIKNKLKRMI